MSSGGKNRREQGGIGTPTRGRDQTAAAMGGGGDQPGWLACSPRAGPVDEMLGQVEAVGADSACEAPISRNQQPKPPFLAEDPEILGQCRSAPIAVVAEDDRPARGQVGHRRTGIRKPILVGQ